MPSTAEIKPTQQPDVFNTSNDVVTAFKIKRVDAIVVDLATAFDLTSTELSHTTIAGQFNAPGGDNWGLLLSKGSGLTPCVDRAVDSALRTGNARGSSAIAGSRRRPACRFCADAARLSRAPGMIAPAFARHDARGSRA